MWPWIRSGSFRKEHVITFLMARNLHSPEHSLVSDTKKYSPISEWMNYMAINFQMKLLWKYTITVSIVQFSGDVTIILWRQQNSWTSLWTGFLSLLFSRDKGGSHRLPYAIFFSLFFHIILEYHHTWRKMTHLAYTLAHQKFKR